jgi:3-deoxy-D-manno-octulosonate 8-phosphate phosphatase (KDO 8-P phosphatase)
MDEQVTEPTAEVVERASRIDLILLDVDGVLTDGRLYMDGSGNEMKSFHTRDGLGIRIGQRGGLLFGIVTGRESKVVRDRAEELYITEIHQRVRDKGATVAEILARVGVPGERACFVGDDLVDVPAMRRCGLAVAPADASSEAIAAAHHVTARRGGDGCVRETIDLVLRARGKWESATERFFRDD